MAQVQSLEDGIFSMIAYTDMGQEQVIHHTNGKIISLKRQIEYKERVEKSTITKCVEFFRGLFKRSSKKNTSPMSNPTKNTAFMHDMSLTISPIPLVDQMTEEKMRDDTMIDRLSDEDEGQELSGMTGFGNEYDIDYGYDGVFDDMGMSGDENNYGNDDEDDEMSEGGNGDDRDSQSYQSTGMHKVDNATTDAADSIRSTPISEYSSPDHDFGPDAHEDSYLTPSPDSTRKQTTTSSARNSPPRSLRMEPATPPSSPPTTRSNDPRRMNDVSDSSHIDTYDPKDGLKVFWAVERVKTRYAQHLGVETLTSRRREEVRRFGNEVLSLIVLDRTVSSVDTKFVDVLFNGYFF